MGSKGREGGAVTSQKDGATSGSATGTNVEPSTSIQKQYTGRSSSAGSQFKGSSTAAGAPGVKGHAERTLVPRSVAKKIGLFDKRL